MNVLRAANAERQDAPLTLGVMGVGPSPFGGRVKVVKSLFVQMPAVGGIDPTTVTRVVGRANEQLSARLDDSPGFVAKGHHVDHKVLHDILGNNHRDRAILPGPGAFVQVRGDIDARFVFEVNVEVVWQRFWPAPR